MTRPLPSRRSRSAGMPSVKRAATSHPSRLHLPGALEPHLTQIRREGTKRPEYRMTDVGRGKPRPPAARSLVQVTPSRSAAARTGRSTSGACRHEQSAARRGRRRQSIRGRVDRVRAWRATQLRHSCASILGSTARRGFAPGRRPKLERLLLGAPRARGRSRSPIAEYPAVAMSIHGSVTGRIEHHETGGYPQEIPVGIVDRRPKSSATARGISH